jgi:hypothetical protein
MNRLSTMREDKKFSMCIWPCFFYAGANVAVVDCIELISVVLALGLLLCLRDPVSVSNMVMTRDIIALHMRIE